jgi:enoyl-CoA hydratase/carnithine racemase
MSTRSVLDRSATRRATRTSSFAVTVHSTLSPGLTAAHKIAALPRQAVEATKRVLNLHVERSVLATIDFALAAETESFDTDDLRGNVARFLKRSSR